MLDKFQSLCRSSNIYFIWSSNCVSQTDSEKYLQRALVSNISHGRTYI